jgi:superfamily II DNA or RNA helicase
MSKRIFTEEKLDFLKRSKGHRRQFMQVLGALERRIPFGRRLKHYLAEYVDADDVTLRYNASFERLVKETIKDLSEQGRREELEELFNFPREIDLLDTPVTPASLHRRELGKKIEKPRLRGEAAEREEKYEEEERAMQRALEEEEREAMEEEDFRALNLRGHGLIHLHFHHYR